MSKLRVLLPVLVLIGSTVGLVTTATAAIPPEDLIDICEQLYGGVFETPNSEPLAACQWNMTLINASDDGSYDVATGAGVTVGVIDSGVDFTHPDVAPNLNVDLSCSFIFDDTPTADPQEIANGDCSNKLAVQDLSGHGTHVASIIAAPINGIGVAGSRPRRRSSGSRSALNRASVLPTRWQRRCATPATCRSTS